MARSIPDREEKIKNAVCFFAFEHERLARRPLTHTSLYKYLAFLDYASIEETGRPALGLLYLSRVRHPLPIGTFARLARLKKDPFIFLPRGGGGYLVKATGEPDVSYFSPLELREMKKLVETYALGGAKVCDAEEKPLNTTGFWKRTRIRASEGVGYDDVFNDDFFAKYKEAYAMASLRALIEKYVAQIKELETRMADVKHKLEIVMEASRLLAEEGLSDEYPPDRPGEER
ncbi:MAG: hypothetical protein ABSH25_03335 [Syntrophorhabdales bacterium]|jgi:hypothetical protein